MDDDRLSLMIKTWHENAQIDYRESYIRLYIAYNAWFSQVTGVSNDRAAIDALKKRFVIWRDYRNGKTLRDMYSIADDIAEYTQRSKIIGVTVNSPYDWQSIIEYWYKVRCHLFHGSPVSHNDDYKLHIELAYNSLNIFMSEITRRMEQSFTDRDMKELGQISQLIELGSLDSELLHIRLSELQRKYINAPDIWNVDMAKYKSPATM